MSEPATSNPLDFFKGTLLIAEPTPGTPPDSTPDAAPLVRALRELHAAENSYLRALAEFSGLLPQGWVLLHRKPGDARDLFWAYWPDANSKGHSYSAGSKEQMTDGRTQALIVEAPAPRTEYLPRLSQ